MFAQAVYRLAVKWHNQQTWDWLGPIFESREALDAAIPKESLRTDEGRFLLCCAHRDPGQAADDPDVWSGHAEHMTTLSGVPQAKGT